MQLIFLFAFSNATVLVKLSTNPLQPAYMLVLIIILTVCLIVSGFALANMVRREERLEEYYANNIDSIEQRLIKTKETVESVVERLQEVDIRGSFEADDEVGFAFKEIKLLNEELLQFIITYNELNK